MTEKRAQTSTEKLLLITGAVAVCIAVMWLAAWAIEHA